MSAMPLQSFTDCQKHGDWPVVRGTGHVDNIRSSSGSFKPANTRKWRDSTGRSGWPATNKPGMLQPAFPKLLFPFQISSSTKKSRDSMLGVVQEQNSFWMSWLDLKAQELELYKKQLKLQEKAGKRDTQPQSLRFSMIFFSDRTIFWPSRPE